MGQATVVLCLVLGAVFGFLTPAAAGATDLVSQLPYPVGSPAGRGATCDLDGALGPDIVVTTEDPAAPISILLNAGDGTFAAPQAVAIPGVSTAAHVTCCDFDSDGDQDLAVSDPGAGAVHIVYNNGGSFAWSSSIGSLDTPRMSACCSSGDLYVAEEGKDRISIHQNDGAGSFAPPTHSAVGDRPTALICPNLGVGRRIVVSHAGVNEVYVLQGPNPPHIYTVGDAPSFLTACDVNGDTYTDLITANSGSDDVTVLLNDGSGSFPTREDHDAGTDPIYVGCGHLDCDRRRDLVTASTSAGELIVLRNVGGGGFASESAIPLGDAFAVEIAELDLVPPSEVWAVRRGQASDVRVYDNVTPSPSTCNCTAIPSGLVSWYPADDCSGTDLIGGNHASPLGDTFCPSRGRVGAGAMGFGPEPSYFAAPDDSSLHFGLGNFTVSAWVRTHVQDEMHVIRKGVWDEPGYSISLDQGRLWFSVIDTDNSGSGSGPPPGRAADGAWRHISSSVARGTPSNGEASYAASKRVDGEPEGFGFSSGNHTSFDSGGDLLFGYGVGFPIEWYEGLIDEAMIFNRALSREELVRIVESGESGVCRGGIDLAVDATTLSWIGWPGAVAYDLVRGDLHTLRSTEGDFSSSVLDCVLGGSAGTSTGGAVDPAPTEAFWFLIRSLDAFGRNTYDTLEGSQRSRRDPGIEAAAGDCP